MNRFIWTKPYYGVQHLEHTRRGYQVTVQDRGTFSEVFILRGLSSLLPDGFFRGDEHQRRARLYAEKCAKELEIMVEA